MATRVPIVGQTFTFGASAVSQADTDIFQAAPTIAAGDFQRSINGGALTNMDNIPTVTPAAGKRIQFVVSAAETTAAGDGGEIYIVGSDAADNEWQDVAITLRVFAADMPTAAENQAGLATAAALTTAVNTTIADNVWDELLAGHLGAGSAGAALSAAGLAGDPWLGLLPGAYGAGTAGRLIGDFAGLFTAARAAKIDLIGSGVVAMVAPVSTLGDAVELVRGDDYYDADGRALEWTSDDWADLTGATISFGLQYNGAVVLTVAGTAPIVGAGSQKVRVELSKAQTTALTVGWPATLDRRGYTVDRNGYAFDIEAVLASGHEVTLRRGSATVLEDFTP